MAQIPVQRTPTTPVDTGQAGYAEAHGVDLTPIARGLQAFSEVFHEKQLKAQEFDLNKILLDETHAMQADFEARKTDPNQPLTSFADNVESDYTKRGQDLLTRLQQQGYNKDLLNQFSDKLGRVREDFWGQGLAYQVQGLSVKAEGDTTDYITSLSQTVKNDPHSYSLALADGQHNIELNPYLTQPQRAKLHDDLSNQLIDAGGKSIALSNPEYVFQKLDPEGKFRQQNPTGSPVASAPANSWQGVAQSVAQNLQLDPIDVAAVINYETAGTMDPNKKGGKGNNYFGLVQFGPAERQKYGIKEGSTPEEWTKAITQFAIDRGFKPGQMGLLDFYSTINAGSPGHYNASDGNGTVREHVANIENRRGVAAQWMSSVETVAAPPSSAPKAPDLSTYGYPDQVDGYRVVQNPDQTQWDRRADGSPKGMGWLGVLQRPDGGVSSEISVGVTLDGKDQEIPLMVPGLSKPELDYLMTNDPSSDNFLKNLPQSIMDKAVAHAKQQLDNGQSPFAGAPAPQEQPKPYMPDQKTGDPLFDAMTGSQQLQVLGWAQEELNRRRVKDTAAMDVLLKNIESEALANGEVGTPLPSEDSVLSTYGPVEGPQKWAEMQQTITTGKYVRDFRTQSTDAIDQRLAALKPQGGDPAFAVKEKLYEAAQDASNKIKELRIKDPGASVFAAFPDVQQQLANAKTHDQRRAAWAAMKRAYDQLGIPEAQQVATTKDGLKALSDQWKITPANQKLGLMEEWLSEMGPMAGRTLGMAGGTEMARDVGIYALVNGAPDGRTNFVRIMQGLEDIKKDPARRPQDGVLTQQYREGLQTAINNLDPSLSRYINDAAAALYVENGGTTSNGLPDDTKLYQSSLRQVLGGTQESHTGFADLSHGETQDVTILPPGTTSDQFETWKESITGPQLMSLSIHGKHPIDKFGRPITLDAIKNEGTFVMVYPGVYGIKMGVDGKFIYDSAGNHFTVKIPPEVVRKAAPPPIRKIGPVVPQFHPRP
jgi:hypothetical protein